jgi:hypothetical protein
MFVFHRNGTPVGLFDCTRCEKLLSSFAAMVALACILVWLKS